MLEIMSLSGGWGSTTIVEDLSLTVGTGEAVAIVGRNGVGKSTLLEIITGRARRSGGTIRLANKDISDQPTKYRARMGLGYVPQSREVFPSLTVREHIAVSARPGQWSEDRLLGLFPPLARRLHSLGGQLSGGEQQMLAIARALSANPKMLLMDEPSEGLAPVVVEQLDRSDEDDGKSRFAGDFACRATDRLGTGIVDTLRRHGPRQGSASGSEHRSCRRRRTARSPFGARRQWRPLPSLMIGRWTGSRFFS